MYALCKVTSLFIFNLYRKYIRLCCKSNYTNIYIAMLYILFLAYYQTIDCLIAIEWGRGMDREKQ